MHGSFHRRSSDKRTAERFDAVMPVTVAGSEGVTQNISAHGVYFESEVEPALGSLVNFTVEYALYGRKHRLLCEGKVVRVDRGEGRRVRVAARLVAPFFEEGDASTQQPGAQ